MHTLITLMALGSVALGSAFVVVLLLLTTPSWRARITSVAYRYGLLSIFILSAASIASTILLQYADDLAPCVLCWWQRVFMYPIAFIALIALIKNTHVSDIADYVLALSIVGGAIALYQHLLQILPAGALIPCDATGDCAVRSVFEFGFVTLPFMALSIFALLGLLSFLARSDA